MKGRAKRLRRGRAQAVQIAVALSLIRELVSPGGREGGREGEREGGGRKPRYIHGDDEEFVLDQPTGMGGVLCSRTTTISVLLPCSADLQDKTIHPTTLPTRPPASQLDSPDHLNLGGTLSLSLLPLRVGPVQVKEEDHQ